MFISSKIKYLFSNHKRLYFGLSVILSTVLLACDPDEGTESPAPANISTSTCKDNGIALQALASKGDSKDKIVPQDEPKFTDQWYLHNTNIKGLDINILPAWQKGYGTKTISVGILDAGVDTSHPELCNTTLITGFHGYNSKENHGTSVAGLIAARSNKQGIIGIVPKAKVYSYAVVNSSGRFTDMDILRAFTHQPNYKQIAVYSASLGYGIATFYYAPLKIPSKQGIDTVIRDGFHGKGSNVVFAAGNHNSVASHDGFLHHYAVISVNAIQSDGIVPSLDNTGAFSGRTVGQNIWITAPTGSLTTKNGSSYTEDFGSTSSATPLVSGSVALLRSEFPNLSWRDVKLILAESAQKYDKDNKAEYTESGYLYSNPSKRQSYSVGMGFGLLDVSNALALAQNWQLLPAMKTESYHAKNLVINSNSEYTHNFKVKPSINFIESLTLDIVFNKTTISEWTVDITSPNGIKSEHYFIRRSNEIKVLSNRFLGSSAAGTWKVTISHVHNRDAKHIQNITLTFRGH